MHNDNIQNFNSLVNYLLNNRNYQVGHNNHIQDLIVIHVGSLLKKEFGKLSALGYFLIESGNPIIDGVTRAKEPYGQVCFYLINSSHEILLRLCIGGKLSEPPSPNKFTYQIHLPRDGYAQPVTTSNEHSLDDFMRVLLSRLPQDLSTLLV